MEGCHISICLKCYPFSWTGNFCTESVIADFPIAAQETITLDGLLAWFSDFASIVNPGELPKMFPLFPPALRLEGFIFSPQACPRGEFLSRSHEWHKKGGRGLFLRFLREANINGLEKHLHSKAQSKYFFENNLVQEPWFCIEKDPCWVSLTIYSAPECVVICILNYCCFNCDIWYSIHQHVSVSSYVICKIDNKIQMIAEIKTLVGLSSSNEDATWVKMEMASMHQSDRISIALKYTSASGCSHESCKLHQIRVPSIPPRLCHMPSH